VLARFALPIGPWELIKRTVREAIDDDVLSLSAQQAYYFFFSLFPAVLTLISIASFFPLANLTDEVIRTLGRVAPGDVLRIINDQITEISNRNNGGLLTFAFLVTLWSSSGAMVSIINTTNAAYDITESRPLWKVRVVAALLTVGLAFFILVSVALVVVGPELAARAADALRVGPAFAWAWTILRWPIVFALVATGVATVYYFAPDAEQDWVWLTPGAVLATVVWILTSIGLRMYLHVAGSFNETYGAIGAVMVLLLWFHLTAVAILLGAELNSEIEHASPRGKDPGERKAGEKRRLGAAAQRYYAKLEAEEDRARRQR
jgi:membrane protein